MEYKTSNILTAAISRVTENDLSVILALQKEAFVEVAKAINKYDIIPLKETMEDIQNAFHKSVILKYIGANKKIVGSVRGYLDDMNVCHVGRLLVHPDFQNQGIGKMLLLELEKYFPSSQKFSLFTGTETPNTFYLYTKVGYHTIDEKEFDGVTMFFMEKDNAIVVEDEYKLRRWKIEDAESLAEHLHNKNIWDNCRDSLPFPYTIDHARDFIGRIIERRSVSDYCIEINGCAIGNISFMRGTDVERFSAEVGYWISEKYWNKGITTDALKNAVGHYLSITDVIRLYASVYTFNKPSMRVLKKVGFRLKCSMEKAVFKNGRFVDAFYFEVVKS